MVNGRWLAAGVTLLLVVSACGGDDGDAPASTTAPTSTTAVPSPSTTTTEVPDATDELAIWPAPDVVFTTPEAAAGDFVTTVLGVPPTLGDFQAGDARSGEIEYLFPGEGGSGASISRSVLLLRQLGADSGWFVIGAVSDNAAIDQPVTLAAVPAGPLTVSGRARGFEATVIVSAFVAGDAGTQLDQVIASGGALATPEPFTVDLDLGSAAVGTVVTVLVRGGTGLETDPGDFSALPVLISG